MYILKLNKLSSHTFYGYKVNTLAALYHSPYILTRVVLSEINLLWHTFARMISAKNGLRFIF